MVHTIKISRTRDCEATESSLHRYQFEELYFHWGPSTEGGTAPTGSEHSVDGAFFPAELQMLGFNSVLYRNMSEALSHAHGTVAISVMIGEAERQRSANRAIKAITAHVKKVSPVLPTHPPYPLHSKRKEMYKIGT